MEIEKLIEELNQYADWAAREGYNTPPFELEKALRTAAEVIRLQGECIVNGYSEKWHRMIDDTEKQDGR